MKGSLRVGLVLCFLAIWAGCGDTFRPIITPNPPAFPDPRATHTVVSVNNNGSSNPGSLMVIDVSGDSDEGVVNVGLVPVHAVQQTANQILIVNHSVTDAKADSLTKVLFSGVTVLNTATISLPDNSAPTFVAVAPLDSTAYVTLPNFAPDPTHPQNIVPSVGVVSTQSNAMVATIPVGNNPAAIAVTPDKNKLYVANQGDGTISNFNTIDRSPRNNPPITLGAAPLWLVARSDSQRVYVLESDGTNGTLAWLDTTATSGPDILTETTISVPGATTLVYDGNLNRLYIPGGTEAAVVDVSQSAPALLAEVTIAPVLPSSRGVQDPCATTAPTTLNTVAAAALPDGSRAYFGTFYEDASGNICPQVTVINTSNNSVKAVAAVPGFPNFDDFCSTTRFRFTMAAGGDSSRIYLANCDAGNVNLIQTSDDTYLLNLSAPPSARAPIPPDTQPPPQNPVFLIAGP
jgi:DNA-binding beta-propeller fold protein YncE